MKFAEKNNLFDGNNSFHYNGKENDANCLKFCTTCKTLGKLGNIVAETLCFLSMFPCFQHRETFWRKENLLPRNQKCVLANSKTFLKRDISICFQCFLACSHIPSTRNIVSSLEICKAILSENKRKQYASIHLNCFPQKCFLDCPY